MDKLAHEEEKGGTGRDKLIAAAFGPGITMETVVLTKA